MRFDPEASWGANAGLDVARKALEGVKEKYPEVSYADLYTLAGVVAVEEAGYVGFVLLCLCNVHLLYADSRFVNTCL
jgi:catalase (peroxidase I)